MTKGSREAVRRSLRSPCVHGALLRDPVLQEEKIVAEDRCVHLVYGEHESSSATLALRGYQYLIQFGQHFVGSVIFAGSFCVTTGLQAALDEMVLQLPLPDLLAYRLLHKTGKALTVAEYLFGRLT